MFFDLGRLGAVESITQQHESSIQATNQAISGLSGQIVGCHRHTTARIDEVQREQRDTATRMDEVQVEIGETVTRLGDVEGEKVEKYMM